MSNKFLLIMGPSGVGKSTVINNLRSLDSRFEYISPYITRKLRPGETDKISVTESQLARLEHSGKAFMFNRIYDIGYATPIYRVNEVFLDNKFPILDWPIRKLNDMEVAFSGKLYRVYLEPPDLETLKRRISDGRDKDGVRFSDAKNELEMLLRGEFDSRIDLRIINEDGRSEHVARSILKNYLKTIN